MQSQIALWSTKYQKAPFVSFSLDLVLIIVISKNKRGCESNCNKRGKKRLATWFNFTFFKIIQFTPNTITCHTPFDFVKHLSVPSEPAEVRWISKCTSSGKNGPTVPLTHPPNVWQTIQAAPAKEIKQNSLEAGKTWKNYALAPLERSCFWSSCRKLLVTIEDEKKTRHKCINSILFLPLNRDKSWSTWKQMKYK